MALQESFAKDDGEGRIARGFAYAAYSSVAVTAVSICFYQAIKKLTQLKGIRRTELQFIGFSIGTAALLLGLFNALGNFLDVRALNRASILILFAAYLVVAGALIFRRIFNARQVFTFLTQRTFLAATLCSGIVFLPEVFDGILPNSIALVLSILISSGVVLWLYGASTRWLGIDGESILVNARRGVIELALKESSTEKRRLDCEALLKSHFSADKSVLYHEDDPESAQVFDLKASPATYQVLCRASWATPESLQRQRASPASAEIRNFLDKHSLAVVVTVPRGSLTPSLIVALGGKANDAPFTYPEVVRLQNIAELMDNTLARSQLTTQAALQAKMEHLAMMSRGLAHDLKNLITPISSYLVHTAPRHARGSLESEVYASAERSVGVMNDYVREALFFSERMELRYESVSLRRIFDEVTAITAARAKDAGVHVTTNVGTVESLRVDGVLILRMLANLVANAIDASSIGKTVSIHAATRGLGWVQLQVIDQGHGIPPEHLERMFDPYFTTKEFGETVRGFGLGLTITQKIVNLHNGRISVQSKIGEGSTLNIDLPVSPPDGPS